MSVFTNAMLLYGLTDQDDNTEELFSFLEENAQLDLDEEEEDDDEIITFEDIRTDLQEKYRVSFKRMNGMNIIQAYSVHCSGKTFDITEVNNVDLKRADDYRNNIISLLRELYVPYPEQYRTMWQLVTYAS